MHVSPGTKHVRERAWSSALAAVDLQVHTVKRDATAGERPRVADETAALVPRSYCRPDVPEVHVIDRHICADSRSIGAAEVVAVAVVRLKVRAQALPTATGNLKCLVGCIIPVLIPQFVLGNLN